MDGLLIDVKSSTKVGTVSQADLHQLLGYLLIDLDDAQHIQSLGLYLSRAGSLVTWTVPEFLVALNTGVTLPELRRELADFAAEGRLDEPGA